MVEVVVMQNHLQKKIGLVQFNSPDSFEAIANIPAPSIKAVWDLIKNQPEYLDAYCFRLNKFTRENNPEFVYHYMKFCPDKLPESIEEISFDGTYWILNGSVQHDPPVSSLFAYDSFGIKVDWMTGFCGEAAISFPSSNLIKEGELLEKAKRTGLYFDEVYNFHPVNISLSDGIWRIKGIVLTVHWNNKEEERENRDMAKKFGIDINSFIKEFSGGQEIED